MELERFSQELKAYQELPSKNAWTMLERRLQDNKAARTIRFYRYMVAASFIAFVAVSAAYYGHIYKNHKPGIFATNENFSFIMIDDLNEQDDTEGIYSLKNVQNLNSAYEKFITKNIKVRSL